MVERVLVLGGAGFIGSSLALGLRASHPDWQITSLDNLRRRGSELNLSRLSQAGVNFIHGDIRFLADLEVGGVDTILDCSAEPSVLAGFSSPQYVLQANLGGTINILELARQHQARLIFLSTSRVYPIRALEALALAESPSRFHLLDTQNQAGVSGAGISEDFPLGGYRSLYGATKLASELLIEEYHQAYGVGAVINRCGVITGPWQMGKVDQGVFVLWMAAHYFQKPLSYLGYGGTGKQVRDLLAVEDLCQLIDYQLEHFAELDGELFNVGGGLEGSLSLLETTEICQAITGRQVPIQPVPQNRPGDVPLFITDARRVQQRTGWHPRQTPRETLQGIYEWIRQHETQLRGILG